ncbi:hypothetical protein RchiOBHm_Chr2g0170761 [Rosa chinensis]|uniref:Uncharacterized protein n=1 Tax=Rosa chinensis TaxID=74649 RepID=A0A2P6S568_ROSCH|nr:hypothetical protein RchiOBHm_Chr2g0170761 [Rosa chinensis]
MGLCLYSWRERPPLNLLFVFSQASDTFVTYGAEAVPFHGSNLRHPLSKIRQHEIWNHGRGSLLLIVSIVE